MKLICIGHDYQYAVEQSLLALFPTERPEYSEDVISPNCAEIRLDETAPGFFAAKTTLTYDGKTGDGTSSADLSAETDPYELEGAKQRCVKLSFFEAARAISTETPPWGALTGVRPGKLAAKLLESGKTIDETDAILRDTYYVSDERRRLCIESAVSGIAADKALDKRDISIYIGIPFCPTRCAYCSFVSNSVEKSFHLVEPYVDALCDEITSAAQMVKELGLNVKSFYMGGGTPTTLTAPQMARLLDHFNASFDLSHCVEYTVEAGRPDTITREKLEVLKSRGTDRISINPQTMENHVLQAIGRRHSAEDIERAMEVVDPIGFKHVNMDLIVGLPEDTPEGFERTLSRVLAMGTDNVTVHTLSLKKGSRIMLQNTRIPTAEEVGKMLDHANPTLRTAGFAPYYLYRQKYMSGSFENVGWCKKDAECLYNIYIMEELHGILSLGAGGSTKMVDRSRNRIERVFNLKFPLEYIQRREKVTANQEAFAAFYRDMAANGAL